MCSVCEKAQKPLLTLVLVLAVANSAADSVGIMFLTKMPDAYRGRVKQNRSTGLSEITTCNNIKVSLPNLSEHDQNIVQSPHCSPRASVVSVHSLSFQAWSVADCAVSGCVPFV